jgi:hypothetical protein
MNEITITGKLQIVDSGQTDIGDVTKTISLSTAGQKGSGGQTVTTTAANLALAAPVTWSNVGILWLRNQSTTAGEDVKLLKSATVFARIKPGEAFPFRPEPDGTTWQVQSATGSPFLSHLASGTTTP